ncbi:MAG: hypothetical protein ABIQ29_00550 [Burkholderiaceae bacterium]
MTFRCLLAAAMAAALAPWALPLLAQPISAVAAPASAPASSPAAAPPGRRVQTPAEKRENSSMPGDLRPEDRVKPQIIVPVRKEASSPTLPAARSASASGGIDDTAARCEAQASRQARERCRAQAGGASK